LTRPPFRLHEVVAQNRPQLSDDHETKRGVSVCVAAPTPSSTATYARCVIDIEDVRAAAQRLEEVAHRTPVFTSRTLDELVGATVFLKAESLQRCGAFKFRGAFNKISSLPSEDLAGGMFASSSGNHGQAVALVSRLLGTKAVILMPEDAPPEKVAATRGYGAEIVMYDRYAADREELGLAMAGELGRTVIPPYDDPLVMAGQGTVALELIEDVGRLDVLLAPVSGGGLIAGCATAATALCPDIDVIGVEPETADDTRRSLEAGERIRGDVPRTIADGLQVPVPGELTFEINRRLLRGVVTVSDREIVEAMAFLFERLKMVVEPSGAAAAAALIAGKVDGAGRRIGVVVSGGNIGADRFAELVGARPPSP
jgi:threonine dehydratase